MHTPSRPTPAVDLELFARAVDHPALPAELRPKIRRVVGSIAVAYETPAIRVRTSGFGRLSAEHLAWFRPSRGELVAKLDQITTDGYTEHRWVDSTILAVRAGRFDATTAPGRLATERTGEAVLNWLTLNAGDDGTYNRMVDMLEEAEEAADVDRLTGPDLARVVFATYVMLGALRVARWARLERFVPQLER